MGKVHRNSLQPGHRVQWFEIERVLGQGGFGITYLGSDTNLDQRVAIKEYLPIELSVREGDHSVHPISDAHQGNFTWGLERFITEARTLARFHHPNIVQVFTVFEANNTAYMVMRFEEGESLQEILSRRGTLEEAELLEILIPLLGGLELVHEQGFIHRDIKPANVFIRRDGSPVLIDFGSARQALGVETKTLTSLVSPGYAPFEQYTSRSDKQGPWTDIYGLGATLYRAIAGRAPQDAVDRSESIIHTKSDIFVPATEIGAGRYSERFLAALNWALQFRPQDRPQTVAQWREAFAQSSLTPVSEAPTQRVQRSAGESTGAGVAEAQVQTAVAGAAATGAAERRVPRRWTTVAALGLLALAALGGGALLWWQDAGRTVALRADEPASSAAPAPILQSVAEHAEKPLLAVQDALADAAPEATGEASGPGSGSTGSAAQAMFRDPLTGGIDGPEMVVIPAGSFRMGDLAGSGFTYERPVHAVTIAKPFAIGRFEVRFDEYDVFARATGRASPDDEGWGRGSRPVVNVDWEDAAAYAAWLSRQTGAAYRLPSEAEWEYAARAGSDALYAWGEDIGQGRANCLGCGSRWDNQQSAPVGSFAANAFGVYDMHGNVWEWTADCWHDSYEGAPAGGTAWIEGAKCNVRAARGGAWNARPRYLRSDHRLRRGIGTRLDHLGFRVARDL